MTAFKICTIVIFGAFAWYYLEKAIILLIKEFKIYKRFKSIQNAKTRRNSR